MTPYENVRLDPHANVTDTLRAETFIYIHLALGKKRDSPVWDSRTDSSTEFLAIAGERTIWGFCTHPADNGGGGGSYFLLFSLSVFTPPWPCSPQPAQPSEGEHRQKKSQTKVVKGRRGEPVHGEAQGEQLESEWQNKRRMGMEGAGEDANTSAVGSVVRRGRSLSL